IKVGSMDGADDWVTGLVGYLSYLCRFPGCRDAPEDPAGAPDGALGPHGRTHRCIGGCSADQAQYGFQGEEPEADFLRPAHSLSVHLRWSAVHGETTASVCPLWSRLCAAQGAAVCGGSLG